MTGETLLNVCIDRHRRYAAYARRSAMRRSLTPYGACRVCSVEVAMQADGPRRVVASCHTPISADAHLHRVAEGASRCGRTSSNSCSRIIRSTASTCEVSGNCELQTVAAKVGIRGVRYPAGANHLDRPKDHSHPYMTSELSKCINCSRCVRACDEIQGQFVLSMHGRGFDAKIIKGLDTSPSQTRNACRAARARRRARPRRSATSSSSQVHRGDEEDAHGLHLTAASGCNLTVATKGNEVLQHSGAGRCRGESRAHLPEGPLRVQVLQSPRSSCASRSSSSPTALCRSDLGRGV